MSARYAFTCSSCSFSVEAWSGGSPYVIEPDGSKRYVYHPSPDWASAVGVEVPHICLDCSRRTTIDSRAPREQCSKCRSRRLVAIVELGGELCPRCHDERMSDGEMTAIS